MIYDNKNIDSTVQNEAMVFVTHVDNAKMAEDCARMLCDHGIPCTIEDRGNGIVDFGFGLFVPNQYFDEAHMLIDSRQCQNGFYDFFFEDTPIGNHEEVEPGDSFIQ